MAIWQFVLTDLDGVQLGEVKDAHERKVSLSLTGLPTASFTIPLSNPRAQEITDRQGDVLLKVYQGTTLRFIGDCVTVEEEAQEGGVSLACNFAGPLWRLSKRLCGKALDGTGISPNAARGAILNNLLVTANGEGDTGIRTGTIATLETAQAGPWIFKPVAEAYTEMAATFAPPGFALPGSYTLQEQFLQAAATGTDISGLAVGGAAAHTWTGGGDPEDFKLDATNDWAYRTAISDVSLVIGGRAIEAGQAGDTPTASFTDVTASVDVNLSPSLPDVLCGLRLHNSAAGCLFVGPKLYPVTVEGTVYYVWAICFVKVSAAGGTFHGQELLAFVPIESPQAIWKTLAVTVDASGRYAVWWYPQGGAPGDAIYVGQNDAFATGGALASGTCAIYDANTSAGAATRIFDNFYAGPPSFTLDTQPVAFEIVPAEPFADTDQSGVVGAGVKIATLNVAERIGTDRPEVVFEYGDGKRALKSYKRVLSRAEILTRAYTLPSDYATAAVTISTDQPAIDARGLFEDVVATDISSEIAALRKAAADLHILFRKQAKQEITFAPSSTAPVFGTDYFVGDTVTARYAVTNVARFNGFFTVYGVDITIDDNGREEVAPTLLRE